MRSIFSFRYFSLQPTWPYFVWITHIFSIGFLSQFGHIHLNICFTAPYFVWREIFDPFYSVWLRCLPYERLKGELVRRELWSLVKGALWVFSHCIQASFWKGKKLTPEGDFFYYLHLSLSCNCSARFKSFPAFSWKVQLVHFMTSSGRL